MSELSLAELQTELASVRAAISKWRAAGGASVIEVDDQRVQVTITQLKKDEADLMYRIRIHPDNTSRRASIRRILPMDRR